MSRKDVEMKGKEDDEARMDNKRKSGIGADLGALTLASQLGVTIAGPIVLGAIAGHWLDGKLGTGIIFFLILLCLGVVGGFVGAYQQIITVTKKKK